MQQVQRRHQQGESISALARAFHLSRGTIYRYVQVQQPPSHQRSSPYDGYRSFSYSYPPSARQERR
ncbi:helix-turn-helix domain-containing protein [Alkalicoccus chagannorensis]|uniref:helix-turn-helix domain-containing protein n=1 Tax=Alkalicoccus chagannorensis TaxID=427072 RepID=UPI0039EE5139